MMSYTCYRTQKCFLEVAYYICAICAVFEVLNLLLHLLIVLVCQNCIQIGDPFHVLDSYLNLT